MQAFRLRYNSPVSLSCAATVLALARTTLLRIPARTRGVAIVGALVVVALQGCGRKDAMPSLKPEVVAEVGGLPITRDQFLLAWERRVRINPTNEIGRAHV